MLAVGKLFSGLVLPKLGLYRVSRGVHMCKTGIAPLLHGNDSISPKLVKCSFDLRSSCFFGE